MYVYQITNLINNKKYIGITNNYKKRWANEKLGYKNTRPLVITNAIGKYGKNNFEFKILFSHLSIEEAVIKELLLIKQLNTLVPDGYNVDIGGSYTPHGKPIFGEKNGKSKLSDEEALYIKDNRNLPMYILYEKFNTKISYDAFKKCYNHKTYTHLIPKAECYPYNFEFSCQFAGGNLEYDEVLDIRKRYNNGEYWKDVWKDYKDKFLNEMSFWNTYNGLHYKLVMPEVFTKENKKRHSSLRCSGSRNGRAKLTPEDVKTIRDLHEKGKSNSEIYKLYPLVTKTNIRDIINFKTWKTII